MEKFRDVTYEFWLVRTGPDEPDCCSQKSQHPSAPALLKIRHRVAHQSAKLAEASSAKA